MHINKSALVFSNNRYNVITTHIANKIIDANMSSILAFVEFTDLDGRVFHIQDVPCLKIVLDLKDEGRKVLQNIGVLLDNIAIVRGEIYSTDILQQVRSFVCSSVPFRIQISKTIELVVCDVFDAFTNIDRQQHLKIKNSESLYLVIPMIFPFFVLLYLLSLIYKFHNKQKQNACDEWWGKANIKQQAAN